MNKIIKITPKALEILTKQNTKQYMSFGVKSGGCSGFQYYFTPCDEKPLKGDEVVVEDNVKIKVCGVSIMNILGTEIDWQEDIMGNRFIFNNPNADFKCGCGSSFG